MEKFVIEGGVPLSGTVTPAGNKNGALPILAAALLTEEEVVRIRDWIDRNYKVEGDLRRDVAQDIKRKIEITSYQGVRHRRSLPVRGQRTHTNARTRKGPKKTVGVKRKKGK